MKEITKTISKKDIKIKRFNNTLLMKLRLHLLLKNTLLWQLLDLIANKIFKKAKRIMVVLTK
jgi:transposase